MDQLLNGKLAFPNIWMRLLEIPEGSNLDAFELQLKRLNICT